MIKAGGAVSWQPPTVPRAPSISRPKSGRQRATYLVKRAHLRRFFKVHEPLLLELRLDCLPLGLLLGLLLGPGRHGAGAGREDAAGADAGKEL
jgi:hypothetical protein